MESVRRWAPVALAVVVAAVVIVGLRRGGDGVDIGRDATQDPPTSAPSGAAAAVGGSAELPGGGTARLNGIDIGVELDPGLPQPEAGMRLDRIDVELCAGESELFVEPSFWMGLGDDGTVHSAHLGIHALQSLTLKPGSCQRGSVDLAVPQDEPLRAVLLVDEERTTVARWSAEGQGGATTPLTSSVEPETATLGTPVTLEDGATVTVEMVSEGAESDDNSAAAAPERMLLAIQADACAGTADLPVGSESWLLVLDDNRMVVADRGEGDAEPLPPGECGAVTASFRVPDEAIPRAVVYAYGGAIEDARWKVD